MQGNRLELGAEVFALLFATADAIEEAGMRLREQHDLPAPLTRLLPRLEAALGETQREAKAPAAPGGQEPGTCGPSSAVSSRCSDGA